MLRLPGDRVTTELEVPCAKTVQKYRPIPGSRVCMGEQQKDAPMKSAILGAAAITMAFALPASAQRVPDTPAAGTKTGSAATGFAAPNGMVNGSTSLASNPAFRSPTPLGYRYYDRQAELLADPRYAPYEELRRAAPYSD
jgi:hypothetical protein